MFFMNFADALAQLIAPRRRVTFPTRKSDLEEVNVVAANKCPGQMEEWDDQVKFDKEQVKRELRQFELHNPEECNALHNEWMLDKKGILIAKGEHAGRCGIFVKHGMVLGDVHVKLVAPGGRFNPVIVESSEIFPGYKGSEAEEEEEEEEEAAPSTTTGYSQKRRRSSNEDEDNATTPGCPPFKRRRKSDETKDDLDPIVPEAEEEAEEEEEAAPSTISGGKYAGKNCIILEYLPHRVRVQIVGSSLITCISRRSLGLDEKKTVWHTQPRRSPRIRAMMEASRKSQALGVDSP
jgi:hypothetical protein